MELLITQMKHTICTYIHIYYKTMRRNRNWNRKIEITFPHRRFRVMRLCLSLELSRYFCQSPPPVFTIPSITHRFPRFPDSSSNLQVQPSWSWEIPDPDVKSKTKTQKHRNTRSMREKCNLFMPKRNYAWNLYEIRGSRLTICCCLCAFAMSEMEIKIDKSWGK